MSIYSEKLNRIATLVAGLIPKRIHSSHDEIIQEAFQLDEKIEEYTDKYFNNDEESK